MLVEQLDQLGEVGERARQSIDLIDQDDIDLAVPDVVEQPLQRWAVQGRAREAAVIIVVGNEPPTFMGLALYLGLTGFSLRIQRVEHELEVMLGRFSGKDRATLPFWRSRAATKHTRRKIQSVALLTAANDGDGDGWSPRSSPP
jgi:hypothetical protein